MTKEAFCLNVEPHPFVKQMRFGLINSRGWVSFYQTLGSRGSQMWRKKNLMMNSKHKVSIQSINKTVYAATKQQHYSVAGIFLSGYAVRMFVDTLCSTMRVITFPGYVSLGVNIYYYQHWWHSNTPSSRIYGEKISFPRCWVGEANCNG